MASGSTLWRGFVVAGFVCLGVVATCMVVTPKWANEVTVRNRSGEVLYVTPIGMHSSGDVCNLELWSGTGTLDYPLWRVGEIEISPGDNHRFIYNVSHCFFSHMVVCQASGQCGLMELPRGQKKGTYAEDPRVTDHAIESVDALQGMSDKTVAAAHANKWNHRAVSHWLFVVLGPALLLVGGVLWLVGRRGGEAGRGDGS